jgi:hypothetical protein
MFSEVFRVRPRGSVYCSVADQVRNAVDKANNGCTESEQRYIFVTVSLAKRRR